MARLDKTYIKTYQQYREIADWCKAQGEVHWRNSVFRPYDHIPQMTEWNEETNKVVYLGEWTEEYFNERIQYALESRECMKTEVYFDKYVDKDGDILFMSNKFREVTSKYCDIYYTSSTATNKLLPAVVT